MVPLATRPSPASPRPLHRLTVRVLACCVRYGPAELVGTAASVITLLVVDAGTGSSVLAAYAAVAAEWVGYYGMGLLRVRAELPIPPVDTASGRSRFEQGRVLRQLVREFGLAEVLDTVGVRPLFLVLGSEVVGGAAGPLCGMLAADLVFYAIVIGGSPRTGLRERF